ncbi:phosphatase PAP2 family protein [Pontibacillus sp. HMF3514]|uniref:phosphatase PAP2 family protein n=1 Tax=Pontibacillus sp. HMF3514 TaxID=2692425 RepID=UPI00131FF9B9|nr:phosphatase PAP2 family protein [Pontibacillus sp. HMF3514]QHE51770.1 phosphatase PAP2 family protein [Pontibacillus sp. HMF3514]
MLRESTSKTFPILAIITILLTVSTLSFYFLVGNEVLNEKTLYIDQVIFDWATAMPDWVKQTMLWVTKVGSVPVLTATSLLLMGYFLFFSSYSKWFAAYFAVNMIGVSGITKLLKIFYNRPRPDETEFGGTSASFPSGHTSGAVAFFGFIIYIVLVSNLSSTAKWTINIVSSFMIVAISISRVFGHIHYPTDVIAGLGIGFSWLFLSILALEMTLMRQGKSHIVKQDKVQA